LECGLASYRFDLPESKAAAPLRVAAALKALRAFSMPLRGIANYSASDRQE